MTDFPQPDLMDQGGRAKRLFLALLVAAAVATSVYLYTYRLADPDHQSTYGGYKFVYFMTAFFGGSAFILTIGILNKRADKKYKDALLAKAKVVD
jgi:fucose permease